MNNKIKGLIMAMLIMIMATGCRKPYKEVKFVDISPSQTAILQPLQGNSVNGQSKLDSIAAYEKNKVSGKRVEIAQVWHQEGRRNADGRWIDAERLIILERSPVTREWTGSTTTGSNSKNQAIVVESESIGYSINISCIAKIKEADSARFLYEYSGKSLAAIMDEEIRSMVETKLGEAAASRTLAKAIKEKKEMTEEVRTEVIPYFAKKGITITNLGIKGQYTFINQDIQDSINKKFIAQKEKEAQDITNEKNKAKATADKEVIQNQKATLKDSMALKKLELQEKWINKWNGVLPKTTAGANSMMMMNVDQN